MAVRIGMHRVRLDVALVLVERVEDVDALIGAARDEAAEQGYVQVGHVVEGNSAETAVTYVTLGEEVSFVRVPLRAVGRDALT